MTMTEVLIFIYTLFVLDLFCILFIVYFFKTEKQGMIIIKFYLIFIFSYFIKIETILLALASGPLEPNK